MNVWICHDCSDKCVTMKESVWTPDTCIQGLNSCKWYKVDLVKLMANLNIGDVNVSE